MHEWQHRCHQCIDLAKCVWGERGRILVWFDRGLQGHLSDFFAVFELILAEARGADSYLRLKPANVTLIR